MQCVIKHRKTYMYQESDAVFRVLNCHTRGPWFLGVFFACVMVHNCLPFFFLSFCTSYLQLLNLLTDVGYYYF